MENQNPLEMVREKLDGVASSIRSVGTRMDEFSAALNAANGRIENVEKSIADKLVSDSDEAQEQSKRYIQTMERELELMRSTKRPATAVSLPGVNEGKDRFFFTRYAYASATGDWSKAGYEKEVLDQTRALTTTTDTAAGALLPIQVLAEMIPLLRARQVLVGLGVTMLDGLAVGEVQIPKQTGGATAYWVSPNTAPTESNLTVGMVTARPRTLAVHTIVERALAERAVPSIENMVRVDAATVWALEFDKQALLGTGESNKPVGVANWPSVLTQSVGSMATNGDFDEFVDMYGQVEDANALMGSPGWIFKPSDFRILAKVKDSDGDYMLRRNPDGGIAQDFLGFPRASCNQLTAGQAFFGNWQDLVLCEWGSLRAEASMQAGDSFLKRQIYLLLFQDVDSIVRHASSFAYASDIAA